MSALAIICFIIAAALFIVGMVLVPFSGDEPGDFDPAGITGMFLGGITSLCCGVFFGAMAAL